MSGDLHALLSTQPRSAPVFGRLLCIRGLCSLQKRCERTATKTTKEGVVLGTMRISSSFELMDYTRLVCCAWELYSRFPLCMVSLHGPVSPCRDVCVRLFIALCLCLLTTQLVVPHVMSNLSFIWHCSLCCSFIVFCFVHGVDFVEATICLLCLHMFFICRHTLGLWLFAPLTMRSHACWRWLCLFH